MCELQKTDLKELFCLTLKKFPPTVTQKSIYFILFCFAFYHEYD